MLEEIKEMLQNANCFQNSDNLHEIQELIAILLSYSLEPGNTIHDIREQLYLIKFDIE